VFSLTGLRFHPFIFTSTAPALPRAAKRVNIRDQKIMLIPINIQTLNVKTYLILVFDSHLLPQKHTLIQKMRNHVRNTAFYEEKNPPNRLKAGK